MISNVLKPYCKLFKQVSLLSVINPAADFHTYAILVVVGWLHLSYKSFQDSGGITTWILIIVCLLFNFLLYSSLMPTPDYSLQTLPWVYNTIRSGVGFLDTFWTFADDQVIVISHEKAWQEREKDVDKGCNRCRKSMIQRCQCDSNVPVLLCRNLGVFHMIDVLSLELMIIDNQYSMTYKSKTPLFILYLLQKDDLLVYIFNVLIIETPLSRDSTRSGTRMDPVSIEPGRRVPPV